MQNPMKPVLLSGILLASFTAGAMTIAPLPTSEESDSVSEQTSDSNEQPSPQKQENDEDKD